MARRFFVDESSVFDDKIQITGAEHNHIAKVLRMKVGDQILVSAKKFEFDCQVQSIEKAQTIAKIMRKTKIEEGNDFITVFQALMKNEHMDFLIQKCTELGVKSFVPFLSKFVVVKPDSKKLDRLSRISFEACKQSGRALPMEICEPKSFKEALQMLKTFEQVVVAYEKDKTPAKDVLRALDKTKSTAIIVGSEGGFDEDEVALFKSVGAKTLCLGKNILRGETAAITLSALVLYEFDEFC